MVKNVVWKVCFAGILKKQHTSSEGNKLGPSDGSTLGCKDGLSEGIKLGLEDGVWDNVGDGDGFAEGLGLG